MKNSLPSLLLVISSLIGWAAPAHAQSGATVTVNPAALRDKLLSSNDIIEGINRVHREKAKFNYTIAELFPTVDVGALALSAVNPTFLISQIQFTLPFLIPTKWFDMLGAKEIYDAEKIAYQLLQLNLLGSAYAAYVAVQTDMELLENQEYAYADLKRLEDYIRQRRHAGLSSEADLQLAIASAATALARLRENQSTIVGQKASIKAIMNLPIEDEVVIERQDIVPSELEELSRSQAFAMTLGKAPEMSQFDQLFRATKWERWGKIFSFIGSNNFSAGWSGGNGSQESVFQNFSVGGGILKFRPSIFPDIDITNKKLRQLRIQMERLKIDTARLVETALGQLARANQGLADSKVAVESAQKAYDLSLLNFAAGKEDFNQVVLRRGFLRDVQNVRTVARNRVNLVRITLNRLNLSGDFEGVNGCADLPGTPWYKVAEKDSRRIPYCTPDILKLP